MAIFSRRIAPVDPSPQSLHSFPPLSRLIIVALLAATGALWADGEIQILQEFIRPGTNPLSTLFRAADGNFYGTASSGGTNDAGTVFSVNAAGITSLHSFDGALGEAPVASLVQGTDGLYGTTSSGGSSGFGMVFKITTAGVFTPLVNFTGSTGAALGSVPEGLLAHTDGNFYGLTRAGGAGEFGTVFKMTPAGAITTLVEFTGTAGARPGAEPVGALVANGNTLYGVTYAGGAVDLGTMFSVTTAGACTLLGEFSGTAGTRPGSHPAAGLLRHTDGNFYGTTEAGGTNDFGTVFKLTSANVYTVLRHFADTDGSQPAGTLIASGSSNLYGTTAGGGTSGFGTIYKITTAGTHTVLAEFTGEGGATPGAVPRSGLALHTDGSLWGATSAGGPGNLGGIFKITTGGTFSVIASCSGTDGWTPSGAPVQDVNGDLLFPLAEGGALGGGTLRRATSGNAFTTAASFGGTGGMLPAGGLVQTTGGWLGVTAGGGNLGRGLCYKYTGTGLTILNQFATASGATAEGPLAVGNDGNFYGVGREGGASGKGTVFKITPAGVRTRLVSFTGITGSAKGERPHGPLARGTDGNFYGVTEFGGTADGGVIFKVTPTGTYTVLSEFAATGPRHPQGGLITGGNDVFCGTTADGGTSDGGTVWTMDSLGAVTVLAVFTGTAGNFPGSEPAGPLLFGPDGTIYGLATAGGAGGFGTLFRVKPSGLKGALLQFTGIAGACPGAVSAPAGLSFPPLGGLCWDGTANQLCGTVPAGGSGGGGVLFRVTMPAALADWKLENFGSTEVADLADADGDGIANILEYALGLSPDSPDSDLLPTPFLQTAQDGARLSIVVPRDPARADVVLEIQATGNLSAPWTTLAISTNGQPFAGPGLISGDDNSAGVRAVQVQDSVLLTAGSRRFLRLKVSH